ncbi:MAG: hypothetical protein AAF447_15950 [Myxococcota bacterium]
MTRTVDSLGEAINPRRCPYEGDWSHRTIRAEDETIEDGAWTYHPVLEEGAALRPASAPQASARGRVA